MHVWNMLHVARWKYMTQKLREKVPSVHHRTSLSGYIFATKAFIDSRKKNLLNSNIFSICLHNMVNFGLLMAEISWQVWDTPANFNGFRVLASVLHRRRSMEVHQTLHDVWPSPGLVHYIYIFVGCCTLTEFCQVPNSLHSSLALSYIWQRYCTALEQSASVKLCGTVQEKLLSMVCHFFHACIQRGGDDVVLLCHIFWLWPPCIADADIIFFSCFFFFFLLSSLFPRLISAVANCMSTTLLHQKCWKGLTWQMYDVL